MAVNLFELLGTVAVDTGEASKNIDDVTEKAEKSEGKMSKAFAAIGSAVVAAFAVDKIVDFGKAVVGMADDATKAMNSFSAATGEDISEFEDVMKNIYTNNFGESFEDIADSMAIVKQQMGDIGADELEELTTDAIMLRDTFDFEVNESMRAAKMLMDQFNISGKEAFNMIAQGAQNGLDKNGDLLDSINEYAVHYKQMGFDAEGFFNSLKNGTEAGTFSVDKLGDALKEFGIRAKDGSASSEQAFSILGLTISDNTEAIQESKKEMEEYQEKIGDLEKKIKYAKMQQESFNEKTSELTKAKTSDSIAEWEKELKALKEEYEFTAETVEHMESVASKGGQTAGDLFERFAKGGQTAMKATEEVLEALFSMDDMVAQNTAGVALFGTMWEDLGAEGIKALMETNGAISMTQDALSQINEVKYNSLGEAMEGIKRTLETSLLLPIGEKIIPLLTESLPKKLEAVEKYAPKILAAFETAIDGITNATTTVKETALPIIQGVFGWIKENGIPVIESIWQGIQNVFNMFTDELGEVGGAFSDFSEIVKVVVESYLKRLIERFEMMVDVWQTYFLPILKLVIVTVIDLAKSIFENVAPAIVNIVEKFNELSTMVRTAIIEYILPVVGEFVLMIQELWEENRDKLNLIGELFGTIFNNISQVVSNFVEKAKNTILPFLEWARDFVKENMDRIKEIFQGAINIISGIIQIFISLFKGDWEGMWQAIKDTASAWWETICNVFSLAWDAIKSIWSASGAKDYFVSIWESIKGAFASVGDWFSNVFATAWQKVKDVFSKGGEIFDGITEGIGNFFTTTVNGIIGGINKVISVPFNAINDALSGIKDIEILGMKPFDWINTFDVPAIPLLEQGGILEKGQVGLLEGNGAEAVVPLDQNEKWINKVAQDMGSATGNDALLQKILEVLLEIRDSVPEEFAEIIAGMKFAIGEREFARLVKAVN